LIHNLKILHSFCCCCCCFLALGFELRASCLWGRPSYHLATLPTLFCDRFFQDKASRTICLGLALNWNPADLCLLSS
jgi:hypothetical protein